MKNITKKAKDSSSLDAKLGSLVAHSSGQAKKTYHLITYGCQMNISDSERIISYLEKKGLQSAGLKQADFIILNLCSVRQKAIDKVWGKITEIKKKNKTAKIILTGCILNQDRKKFKKKVDYLLNITDLPNWLEKIKNNISDLQAPKKNNGQYFNIAPKYKNNFQAYVPIMTGCNNFCSYCAVPYVRGKEMSRPAEKIINEVNKLIVQGYKQIILLGQNVNSYRLPASAPTNTGDSRPNWTTAGKRQSWAHVSQPAPVERQGENLSDFPKLLNLINKIPGNYWLSFLTSHPKDLSDELIECFAKCKHLIPYLNLPLQAGSDKILKAMNRNYTIKNYLKLIDKIRKASPEINLSTDVIVGFPGETRKDFEATKKVFKKVKYDMAYINQYSPRQGTIAAQLEDNVSLQEKKRRDKELTEILKKTALQNNQKMLGKEIEVLIEKTVGTGRDLSAFGKTKNFKNIKIKQGNKKLIGQFVKVKITQANIWNLEGEIV